MPAISRVFKAQKPQRAQKTLLGKRGIGRGLVAKVATFEPQVDPNVVLTQLTVLFVTLGAGAYWWKVVVPSERAALSRSKKKGELKEYLDELEGDYDRPVERWFYTNWLQQRQRNKAVGAGDSNSPSLSEPRSGIDGSPELNLLKPSYKTATPKFISFDNPVVVTGYFVFIMVVAATVQHNMQ